MALSIPELYSHYLAHPFVSTDTRAISEGCLFFALKGDKFNANTFAAQAIAGGAAFAIIDEPEYNIHPQCLLVNDVLVTLQELARYHRSQLDIPVIGLTGSNGKTTTKELIYAVLAEGYRTFATRGNLNNHIGVPLSVLSIGPEIELAIIEMGANHQQEIAFLCSIAQPTHGLITNVGMAHLDGFGGYEGVKKGKAELYDWLKANNGITFVNAANPELLEMSTKAGIESIVPYGGSADASVKGTLIDASPYLKISWEDTATHTVQLNITGAYNFENTLAAICIGRFFSLDAATINRGLSGYQPVNNRSQINLTAANTVICDFYNANPSSMMAAIDNLIAQKSDRKAAILGDMFELGQESPLQHKLVHDHALKAGFTCTIFIGEYFGGLEHSAENVYYFSDRSEASSYLEQHPLAGYTILLKGSRGMALEQLMPLL